MSYDVQNPKLEIEKVDTMKSSGGQSLIDNNCSSEQKNTQELSTQQFMPPMTHASPAAIDAIYRSNMMFDPSINHSSTSSTAIDAFGAASAGVNNKQNNKHSSSSAASASSIIMNTSNLRPSPSPMMDTTTSDLDLLHHSFSSPFDRQDIMLSLDDDDDDDDKVDTPVVNIEADQTKILSQATTAAAAAGIIKPARDTTNTLQSLNVTLNRLQAEVTRIPSEASSSLSSSQKNRQQQQQQQQSGQHQQQQSNDFQSRPEKEIISPPKVINRPSSEPSSSSSSSSRPVKESFTLSRLKLLNATLLNPPAIAAESSPPPSANHRRLPPTSAGKTISSSTLSSPTSLDLPISSSSLTAPIIPKANVENNSAPAVGSSASSSSLALEQQQPQAEQLPQAGTVAARLKAIRDRIKVEL
jgi:hypothetical protein